MVTGVLAAVALAAGVVELTVRERTTAYPGYSASRVAEFSAVGQPLVTRYLRNCLMPGGAPVMGQVVEKYIPGHDKPTHTLGYYSSVHHPNVGISRETGLTGWRGLLTPRQQGPAQDAPPGEHRDCDTLDASVGIAFPSALTSAGLSTVAPSGDDSISWEARAATAQQAQVLAEVWLKSREELRRKGPAWNETVVTKVSAIGESSLERASVRYRGTDGSQVTMEFSRVEGEPSVLAVLVAHKRLPNEEYLRQAERAKQAAAEAAAGLSPAADALAPALAPSAPTPAAP